MFETEMIVDMNRRIIALSDIHADIHALIICLRDCCKVIRKKDEFNFDQSKPDDDLILNLNKNIWDTSYMLDLNYEWCGGDTIVVIVGDLIDGKRGGTASKEIDINGNDIGDEVLYYPHVEVKILYFINYINQQSINTGLKDYGRIIKLFGNHEIGNFTDMWDKSSNYLFEKDNIDMNYINLFEMAEEGDSFAKNALKNKTQIYENRNNAFKLDITTNTSDFGYSLFLAQTGAGILLKINNNIFIHGQLINSMPYTYYKYINEMINSYSLTNKKDLYDTLMKLNNNTSPLWMREWGHIDTREINPSVINSREFCDAVNNIIDNFCTSLPNCNSKDIRVIIGHCNQSFISPNVINSTFSKNYSKDDVREIFTNETIYTGHPNMNTNANNIFGISAECYTMKQDTDKQNNKNMPHIIKVDIGMSRSFDIKQEQNTILLNKTNLLNEEAYYYTSRSPQVLEIIGDQLRIIRSSMKNTSIHLPRPSYKAKLHLIEKDNNIKIKELDKYNNMIKQSIYYNKYIKYKMKYINLSK